MQGYNPLHLACFGGHITVVGLLLSRSAELLHSGDKHGKTGLHIAAQHGRYQMCEVLLGQGAEINATDKASLRYESTILYLLQEVHLFWDEENYVLSWEQYQVMCESAGEMAAAINFKYLCIFVSSSKALRL